MPISPYLDGERFDPETKRVLGLAFELVCVVLKTGDCDDDVYRAIARKPINLNKAASTIPRSCATSAEGLSRAAGRPSDRMTGVRGRHRDETSPP